MNPESAILPTTVGRRHALATMLLVMLSLAPHALTAQEREASTFGVFGGPARFRAPNFVGQDPPTGWGGEGGLSWTSGRKGRVRIVSTLGLLTFRPIYQQPNNSPRVHAFVLGAGVEVPLVRRTWEPVIGAMVGPHYNFGEGQSRLDLSWQAYAGVRGAIASRWQLRATVHGQTFGGWETRLLGSRIGLERGL